MSKEQLKGILKVKSKILYDNLVKVSALSDIDFLVQDCCGFFHEYTESLISNCDYCYAYIGDVLIHRINDYAGADEKSKYFLVMIFYRFLIEHTIVAPNFEFSGRNELCLKLRQFIESFNQNDESFALSKHYSFNVLPAVIINYRANVKFEEYSEHQRNIVGELSKYKESDAKVSIVSSQLESWDADIEKKLNIITGLKAELQNLSSSYNFANISHGFQNLLKSKKTSLHLNSFLIFILTVILVAPPLFKIFTGLHPEQSVYGTRIDLVSYLINYIPFIALDFFVLYFFRIVLSTRKEITTQIVQLELRKSLCQFIESYSEKSKEMSATTPKLLEKFETLIFSGLTTDPTNVPTTFDGLEQLANMIKSIKNA